MENIDMQMQRRVWERVRGTGGQMPPLEEEPVKALLYPAAECLAAYQKLAGERKGREGEILRRLHREQRKTLACLKGICRLQGETAKEPVLPPGKESSRRCLENCCRREQRLWEIYRQRQEDPGFGPVFAMLSRRAGEHWMTLLEILGEMEK